MDILSSRILLRPSDLGRSRRFYRDVLGLAVYREFGPQEDPGVVFFLGQALLEVSGHAAGPPGRSVMIWIQVRDVSAEHARLAAAGVPIIREPATEPWGLIEMWIEDPDGIRIVLVEVPADHPLRRDPRSASPPRCRPICGRTGRPRQARRCINIRTDRVPSDRSRDCERHEELLITARRPAYAWRLCHRPC